MIEFALFLLLVLPAVSVTVLCFAVAYDILAKYVKDEPEAQKRRSRFYIWLCKIRRKMMKR